MRVRISDEAVADIDSIADYTLRVWGDDQTDRYILGLNDAAKQLATTAQRGQATHGLPEKIRRVRYRSHFIFFIRDPEEILVVRVLHEAMNVVRHLA